MQPARDETHPYLNALFAHSIRYGSASLDGFLITRCCLGDGGVAAACVQPTADRTREKNDGGSAAELELAGLFAACSAVP